MDFQLTLRIFIQVIYDFSVSLAGWSPIALASSSSGASSYGSMGGSSTRATPSPPMDSGQTDEGIDSDASSSLAAEDAFPPPKRKVSYKTSAKKN